MQPIDLRKATQIASDAIAKIDPGHDYTILHEQTGEYEFGWAFSYAPRRYLETGDRQYLVPGNGPVVVERNGKVTFLSSSGPPDLVIQAFLEDWRREKR